MIQSEVSEERAVLTSAAAWMCSAGCHSCSLYHLHLAAGLIRVAGSRIIAATLYVNMCIFVSLPAAGRIH